MNAKEVADTNIIRAAVYAEMNKVYKQSWVVYGEFLDMGIVGMILHPIRFRRVEKRHQDLCKVHHHLAGWHKKLSHEIIDGAMK
jgi:hypothetical protein